MDIGKAIRNIRKERGITQIELAEKTGLAVNSIRLYESGKRVPHISQRMKIAEALDCSLFDIMTKSETGAFSGIYEAGYLARAEEEIEAYEKENLERLLASFAVNHPLFIEALRANDVSLRVEDKEVFADWEEISVKLKMDDIEELHKASQQDFLSAIQEYWNIPIFDECKLRSPLKQLPDENLTNDTPEQEKPPKGP